jgi:Domain of unknown function (DUF4375)
MAELEWLSGWSGQSANDLIALEGRFRTDSIVAAFEQALDTKAKTDAKSLTEPEWIVLAVEALEREVNNGGFQQFFINCEFCSTWIADALDRVERQDIAHIAREAGAALLASPPNDSGAMSASATAASDEIVAALDACDQRYLAGAGDLAPDVLAFIKSERAQIQLPGAHN